MPNQENARWPLPQGVVDLFYEDAADKRQLEQALRRLFSAWSYDEIIPPTFEYADTLAAEAGAQIAEEMYRFTDRDGRTLALRPDLTVPTARVAGTRLFDQPAPLRLYYIGPVFRYQQPQAGRQREFTQAGVELIGAGTPAADAEVLALAVETLRLAGLHGFQIVLGQMAFFHGLLQEVAAPPQRVADLQSAIDRQNSRDLELALDAVGAAGPLRQALATLPELHGAAEVIQRARAVVLNRPMADALDWLAAIHDWLDAYGVAGAVSFDLGETRAMQYYTGITFKGYTAGLGFAICSGGRYDDLVGHFGPPQPAVGCAFWLDRILLARQRQQGRPAARPAAVLVSSDDCPQLLALIAAWRARGLRVETDLLHTTAPALRDTARQRHIPRLVRCLDAERVVLEADGAERILSLDALAEEADRWTA